jgi:hypothetical protein
MYFYISANLIYTRPRLIKIDGKLTIIEENVLVKTVNRDLRFFLPPDVVLVLKSEINEMSELFDTKKLGQAISAAFNHIIGSDFDDFNDRVRGKISDEPGECYGADIWRRSDAIAAWSKDFDENTEYLGIEIDKEECFVNGYNQGNHSLESFHDFCLIYSADAFGEAIDEWLEDINGNKLTDNVDAFKEIGFLVGNKWHKENFRFTGFSNVKSVLHIDEDSDEGKKITLKELFSLAKKHAKSSAIEHGLDLKEHLASLEIDFFKEWHRGRLEYFQNSIDENGLSSPHLRPTNDGALNNLKVLFQKFEQRFSHSQSVITGAIIIAGLFFIVSFLRM